MFKGTFYGGIICLNGKLNFIKGVHNIKNKFIKKIKSQNNIEMDLYEPDSDSILYAASPIPSRSASVLQREQQEKQSEQKEQQEQEENKESKENEQPSMDSMQGKDVIPAETVEILNKGIIVHLKPQENKYWHFMFKNEENNKKMTSLLENIPNYRLTVEYGITQNTPDITLIMNGEVVGKIHLLLCDRRDANLPEKYYCKLYFYHFNNLQLFQAVRSTLVNFFMNFKTSNVSDRKMIRNKRNKLTKKGRSLRIYKKINSHKRTHKRKSIRR